jgi:FlgD Ig-like domain
MPVNQHLKEDFMRRYRISLSIFLMLLLSVSFGWSYPDRFAGTRTGAPSETTCASCHGNLNTGPGSASLTISQNPYNPGDTLDLTVTVRQTSQMRWGFDLTVLNSGNQAAGRMIVSDPVNTRDTTRSTGRQYLYQTTSGTHAGQADSSRWNFRWVAPSVGTGTVTFYFCGLAANNDGSNSGDYAYSNTLAVPEKASTDFNDSRLDPLPDQFHLAQNYPNPFNPLTSIEYNLPARSHIVLSVFNLLGQKVRLIEDDIQSAGVHTAIWDGRDDNGHSVASGIYYYRLETPDFRDTRAMLLLK